MLFPSWSHCFLCFSVSYRGSKEIGHTWQLASLTNWLIVVIAFWSRDCCFNSRSGRIILLVIIPRNGLGFSNPVGSPLLLPSLLGYNDICGSKKFPLSKILIRKNLGFSNRSVDVKKCFRTFGWRFFISAPESNRLQMYQIQWIFT